MKTTKKKSTAHIAAPSQYPLAKKNFIMMACSAALIIIGFLLMLGGNSSTEEFNPDIFSSRRIVVGPTIAFLGFVAMGISIIYRPKSDNGSTADIENTKL